jgi:ethanolamine permease
LPDLPILSIAIVAYIVFTAINIFGVKLSAMFELVLTVIAVVELCVFGAIALPHFSWEKFSSDALPNGWSGTLSAIPFAMWFYLAIEGIANVAEEAKNVQRDLPRGFLYAMGTLVVLTAITLFGAVGVEGWQAVVYPDPANTKVTSDSPLPLAVAQIVSRDSPFFLFLTGIGLIGLIASFHGILIVASRSIMELGRVRYAPRILGVVNRKTKTPVAALVGNMCVGLFVLFTGRTADIILISVFGALTLYVLSTLSVIRLRAIAPDLPRPYKTPLYPVTPIIALVLAVGALVAMSIEHPKLAGIYAGILAVAWLAFVIFVPASRRTRFDGSEDTSAS